ncbi:hypothetical protein BH09VER1_BH09VER1_44150 [soil metagenome]
MMFVRLLSLGLAALALASCATPKPAAKPQGASLSKYPIAGTAYELDLKPGNYVGKVTAPLPKDMASYGIRMQTTSVYDLVDTRTGKVVGTAESAFTKANLTGGAVLSERRVEASADGRQILVQDDISVSFPSRRYILFEAKPDGTFTTTYLAPPNVTNPYGPTTKTFYTLPWIHLNDPDFATYPRFPTPFNR